MPMLTQDQVDEFYDIGYLLINDIFNKAELGQIRNAIERLRKEAQKLPTTCLHKGSQFVIEKIDNQDRNSGSVTQIKRVVWCGAAEPALLRFGQVSRLTRIAGQLLGCEQLNHLINQVHFKLPNDGVFFPFHQDSLHRGYGTDSWRDVNGKGSYVQIVAAVDEVTQENGPMLFIPGSGRNGHLNLPYDENRQTISPLFDPGDATPILMAPGSIAVFGPYVIHGSLPNRSKSPRRVFINGFAYPGANSRVYPGEGSGILIDVPEQM